MIVKVGCRRLFLFYSGIISIVLGTLSASTVAEEILHPSPLFCQNFIVRLNPFVALNDTSDSYDESYLLKMVAMIAPKFSNILAPRIGVDDENSCLALVATSVAEYNRKYDSTREKHVSVYMPFGGGKQESNLTSFDVVLKVAERANSVFPETVSHLLVKLKGFNAEQVLSELTMAREKLKEKVGYRLGGLFPLNLCVDEGGQGSLPQSFFQVVDQMQLIVFSPSQKDYFPEVTKTIHHQIERFNNCKTIMKKLNPFLDVGFRTSWPDTDVNGKRNLSNFNLFWKEMNNWAWETDTKIFMLEAFDIPIRGGNDKTKGWWRLDSRGTVEDWYEEKLGGGISKISRAKVKGHNNEKEADADFIGGDGGTSFLTSVLISVFASLLLLSVVGAAMFLLYAKVTRKIGNQPLNYISKSDIQDFFEGTATGQPSKETSAMLQDETRREPDSLQQIVSSLDSAPYNMDYELEKDSFSILESSVLGSGNFGVVCRGIVKVGESEDVEVAVKMFRPGGPTTGFKGLLSETKLHSRLGKHENVVNLIGAYTAELKMGVLYVFTELCEVGSLEAYLRKSYPIRYSHPPRKDSTDDNEANKGHLSGVSVYANEPIQERGNIKGNNFADAKKLYRWSYEIACGMEYLASRKVVHADLATRNVLLTKTLTAKISDFGLSRRLYDYSSYVKSNQEPLPWPWMAPESLRRMEFNEKTDVWSYGITLWEIYSLGDRPYPGLTWTFDLASKLANGMRPEEPQYNADYMYTKMLKCWHIDPARRPSFIELKETFSFKRE